MHILSGKSKCIGGSTSRERGRERDCMVLAHKSFVLAWFLRISTARSTMFRSTNQTCYNCFRWGPMRGSRNFCQRGFNSATLTTFFFFSFFRGERIYISLKAVHHGPASEAPSKWRFTMMGRWWPNFECWLGSFENFENFRRSVLVLPRNSIFWDFSGGGGVRTPCSPSGSAHGTGQCIYLLSYTENNDLIARIGILYDTLRAQFFLNWQNILSFLNSIRVWSGSKPYLQM